VLGQSLSSPTAKKRKAKTSLKVAYEKKSLAQRDAVQETLPKSVPKRALNRKGEGGGGWVGGGVLLPRARENPFNGCGKTAPPPGSGNSPSLKKEEMVRRTQANAVSEESAVVPKKKNRPIEKKRDTREGRFVEKKGQETPRGQEEVR